MARNKNVRMKAPSAGTHVVSVEGVEYEGKRGFFEVSSAHAGVLEARPFNFQRVGDGDSAEDNSADNDGGTNFKQMSKAELIDFCMDRGAEADRKMSKEELVALADSVKDKQPAEEA